MSAEIWARPIETLAPELRRGDVSPVELVDATLARIERVDKTLQSFIALAPKAREAAQRARDEIAAGRWRGPLHGVPIGIKDNYLTEDMPTTVGSTAPGLSFARRDSAAASRFRAAGAVLVGKTRTHEFAWGNVTPPTRNPWDIERIPGGSSGGSGSAVAARLCAAAMGSDTGGSIRIPASLSGTVGLKPTFGRVSRDGIIPHSWSLDHAGPLTQTVGDAALMLNVLAGHDPADPGSKDVPAEDYTAALGQPIQGLRIGVCRNHFFERNEADVDAAVEAAIRDLSTAGATVRELSIPNLRYGLGAIFAIELASSTAYHDASLRAQRVQHFQPDVQTLVEIGRLVTGPDYLKAEQFRQVLISDFRKAFDDVDILLSPTTPLTAWKIGEWTVAIGGEHESVLAASWRLTYPFNLTGLPAISVPCGFDRRGLPIGLQLAGRPFEEATIIRVAHAYERAHDWHRRLPDIAA
jgi:aspartyl-tRNA(Asn)/glutamyl-tRNA(Gln) amidotransferase subunit A